MVGAKLGNVLIWGLDFGVTRSVFFVLEIVSLGGLVKHLFWCSPSREQDTPPAKLVRAEIATAQLVNLILLEVQGMNKAQSNLGELPLGYLLVFRHLAG